MSGGRLLPPEDEDSLGEPDRADQADRAEQAERRRHHRTLYAYYLTAHLLGFGAAVLALHQGHSGWGLTPALVALFPLAHAGGVARREDRRAATGQLRVFLAALLTALVASLAFWLVLSALDADVTRDAKLTDADGLGTGATAHLRVDAGPGVHDELALTVTVTDDDGGQAPCVARGALAFAGADLARGVTGETAGEEVSVTLPLKDPGPRVSADVLLTTDRGCRLSLRLDEAVYR